MGPSGLEPPTSRLSGVRSNHLSYEPIFCGSVGSYPQNPFYSGISAFGGDKRDRTADPLLAKQVLSQLSYTPISHECPFFRTLKIKQRALLNPYSDLDISFDFTRTCLHRKEVIQPHLPIRLPCYDFTPITSFTFGGVLLAVRLLTSGITGSHGVTGGVYKTRERIHRGMLIHDY